jgi:CHAT domain-containing protein
MPRVAVAVLVVVLLTGGRAQSPPAESVTKKLEQADRLAWLKNWLRAEPQFAELEAYYRSIGDERNAVYAQVSGLRGRLPRLSLLDTSNELADILDQPITRNDDRLRLRVLVVKGDVDMDLDAGLAEGDWTEALAIAERLGDTAWANRATGELGIIGFLLGDTGGGSMKVFRALSRAKELNDVAAQVRYLTVLASGLSYMGNADAAAKNFREALALTEAHRDLGFPFLTYSHMAAALVRSGERAKARETLEHLLRRARDTGSSGYEAETLLDLGRIALKEGDRATAHANFTRAAELARSVDGHRLVASGENELSKLATSSGKPAEALQHAENALDAAEKSGDVYHLPPYFAQLAAAQLSLDQVEAAVATYERASDVIEAMLPNVASQSSKAALISSLNDVIVGHVQLLAGRGNKPEQAQQILERARGRSLADAVRGPRAVKTPQWMAAQRRISQLQAKLLKTRDAGVRRRLLADLQTLEQQMSPAAADSQMRAMRLTRDPLPVRAIQSVLARNEALLEYVVAEPESLCFVITRNDFRMHRLGSARKIREMAATFMKAVAAGDDEPSGSVVYDAIIRPLGLKSTQTRLVVVPDGPLYRIPFDALVRQGRRLNDDIEVSLAPSGTVLALLRGMRAASGDIPYLGIGVGAARGGSGSGIHRGVYDAELSALPELQAAAEEARTIGQLFGRQSVLLTGDRATEIEFKQQPLQRARVIHFAAHAVTSTKYPDRSALVFRTGVPGEDGLLQAREIVYLPLAADLVTLSACDTGDGRVLGQEGIANLARPFLMAGAKSVVATLWKVDDEFARGLMTEFYTKLVVVGYDKGRALAEAKRAMRRKFSGQAATRLWAAFVLIGDDRGKLRGGR